MIRVVALLVVSIAVSSTAEEIPFITCFYPEAIDGPSAANLTQTNNGFELEVKFWANEISPNSPLKIKLLGSNYDSIKLINVLYPIETSSADNKYTEYKVTVPVPHTIINDDKIQLSLHKVDNHGNETSVWCLVASVRVLNGMSEEVSSMPTMIDSYPMAMNDSVVEN